MNKKPSMPRCGTIHRISAMRSTESATLYFSELACWFKPLRMPSTTLSTYITGISGASTRSKNPTSALW